MRAGSVHRFPPPTCIGWQDSSGFEEELPASIEQLEELNPELADDYRSMMRLICDVIIEADETVTEREKEDAEHLKALL